MSEKDDKQSVQSEEETPGPHQGESESDLEEYQFVEGDIDGGDLDIEEDYINRIKIQRKRIEELSLAHSDNEEKLRRERERNRVLEEEIRRLSTQRDYESRYSEVTSSLSVTMEENTRLKGEVEGMKHELLMSSNEKSKAMQELNLERTKLRDRENARIEQLEDELLNKQDQLERLARQIKLREREVADVREDYRQQLESLNRKFDGELRAEQMRAVKFERELESKKMGLNDFQANTDALMRENTQLKEEVYRLGSALTSRELELKTQGDKFKAKYNSMKKDLKARERECMEAREQLRRQERESKETSSEREVMRIEIRKLSESLEMERSRWEGEASKERQRLQAIISQHMATIQELMNIKNGHEAELASLRAILKKKESIERERKKLLKTELREIDRLEKVIDRIVE